MSFSFAPQALAGALAARGYETPTAVQAAVSQPDAAGRDLLVSAQTGSGKTVAFGLAMAADLLGTDEALPPAGAPLALVVAPTRELALQVHAELSWLYAATGGKVLACVGGMDPRREQRLLAGGAHIVVGTPGRLRDHIERRQLNTAALRVVVLDEADEMLDLGFREDLEFILESAPRDRRTLLFSATLPREIVSLARRFQQDAVRIDAGGGREPHADIAYSALMTAPADTMPAIINVLRSHEAPIAIVFCATRDAVRGTWAALTERGFMAVALSGEMSQADRNQALLALRSGRARVCVATDVAARGLDLPELSLVIHAELPMNAALLLHRSGRTGRAGRKGASVLLVTPQRRRRAEALLRDAGVNAEWGSVPDAETIRQHDHARLLSDPILAGQPDADEASIADALLAQYDPREIAVALLRLHRGNLPEEAQVTRINPGAPPPRNDPASRDRHPRARAEIAPIADAVWLSASVGRRDNADPKWLLPLLCRIGQVDRREIGAIRVLPAETRFEVPGPIAAQFLDAAPDATRDIRFSRTSAPGHKPHPGKSNPGKPYHGKPGGKPTHKHKQREHA